MHEDIKTFADIIDKQAAAGPAAANALMPYDGPAPSMADRLLLGEMLACGTP